MLPHSLFIWILCLLRDVVYSQPATGSLVKYWGGPLLTQPVIQPIWIGNYAYKNQTINFYTQLFKSRMMTMLTQYYQLADNGTKTYVSPARLLTPIDATGLTDSKGKLIDIESGEQLVARLVDTGKLPAKTRNTLYVFHYGADQSTLSSSVFNCTETASYHKYFSWSLSTGELLDITYYIVVKPCAEQVFKCFDAEGFDNLSCVMTHEIMEAIVDPGPTPGWTGYVKGSSVEADPLTAEVGDLCDMQGTMFVGTDGRRFVGQKIYSVLDGGCWQFEEFGGKSAKVVSRGSGRGWKSGWGVWGLLVLLFL